MLDLLGQPYGKFDYKVKYRAPSTAHVLLEDIVPLGWGEEFDKKDGLTRIVQSPNLQVMRIDILYDSDEKAKESTNVQEHDDSEIIVYNAKAVSQGTP